MYTVGELFYSLTKFVRHRDRCEKRLRTKEGMVVMSDCKCYNLIIIDITTCSPHYF